MLLINIHILDTPILSYLYGDINGDVNPHMEM